MNDRAQLITQLLKSLTPDEAAAILYRAFGSILPPPDDDDDDLMDADATCRFFGGKKKPIDRATLYRGVKAGIYPPPAKVSPNISRWIRGRCRVARDTLISASEATRRIDGKKGGGRE
jgi:hypothetical protein